MRVRAAVDDRRPWTLRMAAVFVVAMVQVGAAAAQDLPFNRGVNDACVDQAMEADQFADVHLGQVHSDAIDCLWVYGVVQGRFVDGENVYEPAERVNRQQMASFIVRMLQQLPDRYYLVPEGDDDPRFDDSGLISDAHVRSVNRLNDAGIIEGYTDGTYRPGEDVNRAQMAAFIARSIEEVLQDELPRAEGLFDDIAGTTHEESIEKLATAGIVQGRDGSYHPGDATTRAQMASFIARAMDYLVNAGVLVAMEFGQGTGTTHVLSDIDWGQRNGWERVTFTLEGDDGTAGWRIRYVDAAIQHGSGMELEVEGDAILQVILTGTAPPDTGVDFDAYFGGDVIVEVVDGGWFEGRHLLFVGTTGLHDFGAAQLDDPRGVFIDVFPG
jgi:hypothetical protein